jgi:hypothetical protein
VVKANALDLGEEFLTSTRFCTPRKDVPKHNDNDAANNQYDGWVDC